MSKCYLNCKTLRLDWSREVVDTSAVDMRKNNVSHSMSYILNPSTHHPLQQVFVDAGASVDADDDDAAGTPDNAVDTNSRQVCHNRIQMFHTTCYSTIDRKRFGVAASDEEVAPDDDSDDDDNEEHVSRNRFENHWSSLNQIHAHHSGTKRIRLLRFWVSISPVILKSLTGRLLLLLLPKQMMMMKMISEDCMSCH